MFMDKYMPFDKENANVCGDLYLINFPEPIPYVCGKMTVFKVLRASALSEELCII